MDTLSAVIGIATALGTLAAAVAAAWAVWINSKQVKTIRDQAQQALEAQYDQQRPLLVPRDRLGWFEETQPGGGGRDVVGYSASARHVGVTIVNIGPGVALEVEGRLFGPESEETTRFRGHGHSLRLAVPLVSEEEISDEWRQGATMLSGADMIGDERRYPLHAPPIPGPGGASRGEITYSARLTLSYRDIFARKHASLWNVTDQGRWESVGVLRNITRDLRDLEREAAAVAIPRPRSIAAPQPLMD